MEILREINAPSEVIREFQRSQHDPSRPPEIYDLETLMRLDEIQSQSLEQPLPNLTQLSAKDKMLDSIQRKPSNLICQRCFSLKHLHQSMDYKSQLPSNYAGSATHLA